MGNQGRPTSYKPEYDQLAFNYSLLGATDKDLAKYFDVSEATIDNWKIDYPSFFESIKDGKEKADANVAQSLYKKALGYKQKTQKAMQYQGDVVIAEVDEEVPPDTTAAIFWLKNRQGKNWRDKQEIALAAPETIDVDALKSEMTELLKSLSPEEKAALTDD